MRGAEGFGMTASFWNAIQATGRDATAWLPKQASEGAPVVDWLFDVVTWISIFFFVLITAVLIVFVAKYRRRAGHAEQQTTTHHQALEVTWTVIPLVIVIWIFWEGFTRYLDLHSAPLNSYEIQVLAQKWNWAFTYPNGYVDANLHVPAGQNVKLTMTSQDVLHSLYVPVFRVKKDVVPGRYTSLWFRSERPGDYDLFCTEYCGTSHSNMLARVIVHPPGEFETWLADAANYIDKLPPEKLWEAGQKLYQQRGCAQCHSIDGKAGTGPSFKGLWNNQAELKTGDKVLRDENYVRTSILNPQAQIVAGYEPVMPTYQGRLKDKEITAIIEYIKTLEK